MAETPLYPVDLSKPRYDQSTFLGRLRHFLNVTDMRTLFTSKARIEKAKANIAAYNATGRVPPGGVEELWADQKVRDTCLHPDTGEEIPAWFRISGYVPANMVIASGLLLPGGGVLNQAFWQWVNQSYNIALNHANRNASNPVSNKELALNYTVAVTTSVGVAVGMTRLAPRLHVSPRVRQLVLLQVPFTAVAISNVVNVFMIRRNELEKGIHVRRQDGVVVGQSQKAGLQATLMTSVVRVGSSFPLMTLVPLATHALGRLPYLQARPLLLKGPVNLACIFIALMVGLPTAVSLFPQDVAVDPKKLEPRFHNLTDELGRPVDTLYFNRGL